ncbi:MGMT family protein [Plebeiibacterium sediminum]|uniref:MGMT family protein n=1 Tax=Plebeiibacterium sediminum TaxID=2992112 RepID=A0AAE3SDZ2_9BACT|nr:MGMT family protein [Plebeiobacterium sediminum]MCW3785790.1 MGMT family protein [Plebeiobacterium sediminum]
MEPDFNDKVFEVVKQIPFGRVTTYGAIARFLGVSKSSRMVGWALNKCSLRGDYIPAHRVVNRVGLLTGKAAFSSERVMEELLESEGVRIENDKVKGFDTLFWDPQELLKEFE